MASTSPKPKSAEPRRAAASAGRAGGHAPPAAADLRPETVPEWARPIQLRTGALAAGGGGATGGDAAPGPFGVVIDGGAPPGPGQISREAFVQRLEQRIRDAADAELALAGRTAKDCPYLDGWLAFYRDKPGAYLERTIRHFAGNARATPESLAVAVEARVRAAVRRWRETGDLSAVPRHSPLIPSASAPGEAAPVLRAATSQALPRPTDPAATVARLGPGTPLDTGVRSRMEGGLGGDLRHVRVHTDATAATLARHHDARAFTVGEHVAFAEGAYRPGTPVGDAVLAHELAHARQQRAADRAATGSGGPALERDADRAAAGALGRLWTGTRTAVSHASTSLTTSGLALQRCSPDPKKASEVAAPALTEEDEAFLEGLEAGEELEEAYEAYQEQVRLEQVSAGVQGTLSGGAGISPSTYSGSTRLLTRFGELSVASGEVPAGSEHKAFVSWKAKKAQFEALFERVAVAEAYGELERNELLVQGELDRYATAAGVTALRGALEPYRHDLEKVRDERAAAAPVKRTVRGGVYVMVDPPGAETHRAAAKALSAPIRKALAGAFPIVAAEDLEIERVLLEPQDVAARHLSWLATSRIDAIQKTRGAIQDKPARVWKFERAVQLGRQRLNIVEGSVYDLMIKDRYATAARDEFFTNLLVAALAIGLGLLSAGTGTVAVLAAAGGAAISGVTAATHLRDFLVAQAATGTAFDKAQALSSDEPSLFWLAVDVVVAFADIGMAARAFRALKPVAGAIKTAEDAEKLRAPAKALAEAEKLANPEATAELVVQQAKQHVAAEEIVRAATAADKAAVDALRAVVKDETAVAGLLRVQKGVRTSLLAAFKEGALTSLGRMIEESPQIAKTIEGLAEKLPARQFEWVMKKFVFSSKGILRTGRSARAAQLLRAASEAGLTPRDFELIADALKTTGTQKGVASKIGGLLIERISERLPGGAQGIETFRKIAPGLHPNQSAQIFERWAAKNVYGQAAGAERFQAQTAKLAEDYKALTPKFEGSKIATDSVVRDAARPNQAGIVDFKSHLLKRNIGTDADAVKQANNYAEMMRVGVKTPGGEKFTWVEYLFASRDSAEASYKFLRDKFVDAVKVFYVDERGAKTLFVPAGP